MVATRRGVRVSSPSKTNPEQLSDVPATPSRTTRRTAKRAESPPQQVLVETSSQLDKTEGGDASPPPTSSVKRCTRASRLHSPELPCTPVDSTHEADVSDVESCCSLVLDSQPLLTRSRGRRRQPRTVSQEDEVSEAESCSSAVSASMAGRSTRRSTRKKTVPQSPPQEDVAAESCSSVVSESQRVTRSQRKTTRTRLSVKQLTEDSELSEADFSGVSGAEVAKSVTRRAPRLRKQTAPIPLHLDEASDGAASPSRVTRRTRRGKAAGATDVSEPQSCESEGFESGPTYSLSTRRRKALDSDCEATPCSSRTGSGHSHGDAPASMAIVEDLSIIQEKAAEAAEEEEDTPMNDSKLETTVIAADADCTLLEEDEDKSQKEEITSLTSQDGMEKGVLVISDDSLSASHSPIFGEETVSRPAVTVEHHHEELKTSENQDEEATEMKTQQESILVSGPLTCSRSVTVTCERTEDITEETEVEAMETNHEDPPQQEEPVDEVAAVETGPTEEEEEKMEVETLKEDARQVSEFIQVTPSQQQLTITVDSDNEEPPKDITVQKNKTISLLESSEDEVSEEEEVSEEDDSGNMAEEQAGPSYKPTAAASSMDGLFMIDTRPGQEGNEQYYKDKPAEEEAAKEKRCDQEDEFVDEEGDDDDDDTNILFSIRNPLVKEMSSRIDPGIRMKELGGLYINFDGSKSRPVSNSLPKLKEKKVQDEVMKKCVIGPDFEKKDSVPPYTESKKAQKLKRRVEREKTTGDAWFNMKAPELTEELKRDLKVLQMRGSLDPKRFYKKNDRDGVPKYFQIGTVVDNPEDFYHSRIPKKERKRTMVEELLADAEFRNKNKKKFQQIVAEEAAKRSGKKKKLKFLKKKA